MQQLENQRCSRLILVEIPAVLPKRLLNIKQTRERQVYTIEEKWKVKFWKLIPNDKYHF